ncbi:MAG: cobalamin-dependent protein [Spirochaetota bacterium]|nr:MAG: cobalamin-dependent protein [Spirochaetota bacterium]
MDLKEALANLEENTIYDIVKKKLDGGASAKEILQECQKGMKIVGERYNRETYFVADLMYAGEIMRNVMNTLSPHMKGADALEKVGTVIMGTVKGDIHDLGKDVVNITLQGNGFEVVDLGVDVSAEKFVEAIQKNEPQIVGLSVFLTSCFPATETIVKAIADAGLRDKVKIMLGGAPVTDVVADETGCDYYGKDAAAAVVYALDVVGAS